MVNKDVEKAASPVDTQGDAEGGKNPSVTIGSALVPPSPTVVTRSQTRAASESPRRLVGSPKKLAASRKTGGASAGSSARVPARVAQVAAIAPQVAVPLRPRADSPIDVDEGEPQRSGANRRLDDAAMEVEVTPSRVPSPPRTRDPWSGVLQDRRNRRSRAEAVATPAARAPSEEPEYSPPPESREPVGTLGAPSQMHPRLELSLAHAWARLPRDVGTISWEDLFAGRRRDAMIVYQATLGYSREETESRNKWLCTKIGRIQVPVDLVSDRAFLLEYRDALYLERVHEYLRGQRARPPILDPEFWVLDLPTDDTQTSHDCLNHMRAEWSLCVGFKKIIAFADYLALHDNTDGRARTAFDVCSVPSRDKCTRFRGNPAWDELPPLVVPWVGVRGLTMKLPKILYYLGSECVRRTHFKDVDPEKFEFILEFEMVHALCCALFVDYRQGQVWILEESAIELLENNSQAPDILTPGGGVIAIRLLAQACRQALALPVEFLWERLDFCSQHRVRWAAHDKRGSFIKASEYRGPRFKSKPLVTTVRAPAQVPITYTGGLGSGSVSRPALRSRQAPVPRVPAARDSQVPRSHRDAPRPEVSAWEGVFTDDSIRAHADGELVVRGVAPRAGGWAMRDILCRAAEVIRARDNTIYGLREDQARLEQELDRARSRGSWNQGHGYVYQEPKRQRMELDTPRQAPARPSAGGSTVTAEGRGAPAGYTPYRASTPVPVEPREVQGYPDSADRGDFYANYVREHGRAAGSAIDPYASRGRAPSAPRRLSAAERAEILRRNPYADV